MGKPLPQTILQCPECARTEFDAREALLVCRRCGFKAGKEGARLIFSKARAEASAPAQAAHAPSPLEALKARFRRHLGVYEWLTRIFSPIYGDSDMKLILKRYRSARGVVLNLGSGNADTGPNITNVDFHPYENVDLACDITKLPLQDESVDVAVNIAVLEHVQNPEAVVAEILRVLKRGGTVYSFVPFMQGFHAAPSDYTRWTIEGMRRLYRDFEIVELKPAGGPTSAMLWVVQEWFATVLSFGSRRAHGVILMILMALTFPVKFLDVVLVRHPFASNISAGFALVGKKR